MTAQPVSPVPAVEARVATAHTLVGALMEDAQLAVGHRDAVASLLAAATERDPEFAARVAPHLQYMTDSNRLYGFGLMFLLQQLARVDHGTADFAAEHLVSLWGQDSAMASWLTLWRDQRRDGLEVSLPGDPGETEVDGGAAA